MVGVGAHLAREWNGRTYRVEVTDDGCRMDGRTYRTLVRLSGLSLKEAAVLSGSTVAAIKVAVHRAARKLQALIWDGRL